MQPQSGSPLTRRALLGGTAALAMGCWSSPSTPVVGTPRQVIAAAARQVAGRSVRRLRLLYPQGCLGNLRPVLATFARDTGIEVEPVEASLDEISAEMILAHQLGGVGPAFDVAIPATFGIPDLAEAGALEPLDTFGELVPEGLAPPSLYTLGDRYRGRPYGLQTDGDCYVMFYRRSWLADEARRKTYEDAFGIPLAVPGTWAELDRQLAFFHEPDAGRYGGSLYRNRTYIGWEFWIRMHAAGVYPVGPDLQPRFTEPECHEALSSLVAASAHLEPGASTNGLFENFASYADGTKYANIGWGGTQKHLRGPTSAVRDKLEYGLVPGGTFDGRVVPMPYFNWGWNYVVSSRSTLKQLAYLFVRYAATPRASTESVREASGYFDPFRTEHYADQAIVDTYGQAFLDVHRQSLAQSIPDFYLRGTGRYMAALKQAVHAANVGQLSVKRSLDELTTVWNRITDELGRERQVEQWTYLSTSYPEQLRAVLR